MSHQQKWVMSVLPSESALSRQQMYPLLCCLYDEHEFIKRSPCTSDGLSGHVAYSTEMSALREHGHLQQRGHG